MTTALKALQTRLPVVEESLIAAMRKRDKAVAGTPLHTEWVGIVFACEREIWHVRREIAAMTSGNAGSEEPAPVSVAELPRLLVRLNKSLLDLVDFRYTHVRPGSQLDFATRELEGAMRGFAAMAANSKAHTA